MATEVLDDGTLVLVIEGELDLNSAPEFERRLETTISGSSAVLIDLTECSFLDSSALNVLVRARNRLDGSAALSLVIPDSHILKVFEMTHLDSVFDIQPTRTAAPRSRQPRHN